jgi:hypothetical protein
MVRGSPVGNFDVGVSFGRVAAVFGAERRFKMARECGKLLKLQEERGRGIDFFGENSCGKIEYESRWRRMNRGF